MNCYKITKIRDTCVIYTCPSAPICDRHHAYVRRGRQPCDLYHCFRDGVSIFKFTFQIYLNHVINFH